MTEITILTIGTAVLVLVSLILSEYNFFSPSFIACLMMLLSSSIALYATHSWNVSESIYSMKATFIILSGLVIFIVCEQFAKMLFAKKKTAPTLSNTIEIQPIHIKRWLNMFVIIFCAIITIAYCRGMYQYVGQNGYSGTFDIGSIASYYHKMTFWDEKEGGISWVVSKSVLCTRAAMYVYVYIFVNNVIGAQEKIWRNLYLFAPIIVGVSVNFISSSRSSLLQIAGAFVLFVYIFMCRRRNWTGMKRNFSKITKMAVGIFCLIILLFYISTATGLIGRVTNKTFFDYIAMYVGAPVIHFNQFITSPPADVKYFGEETFAALNPFLVRLGLRDGLYSRQLEMRNIVSIYSGNVYTFFRRPLHDFGMFGMYIVTGLTSYLFSRTYYKKIYRKPKSYKTDLTLIIYGYFYYVIYLFSIMNDWCNLIATNTVYFLFFLILMYPILTERIKLRKWKLIINKGD